MQQPRQIELIKVKVWDLPVRLFHWGMLGLLVSLWWTAQEGEMEWHQIAAYSLMILILFRLIWGFIGSDTAKFSHFLRHPRVALDYIGSLRRKEHHAIGHNPLGGYMVVVMMLALSAQLATGLFATDEIFTEGPLMTYVSEAFALQLTWLHKMNFNFLLLLGALHITAILIHQLTGDKLVGAMITGYKKLSQSRVKPIIHQSSVKALIVAAILTVTIGYLLILPLVENL